MTKLSAHHNFYFYLFGRTTRRKAVFLFFVLHFVIFTVSCCLCSVVSAFRSAGDLRLRKRDVSGSTSTTPIVPTTTLEAAPASPVVRHIPPSANENINLLKIRPPYTPPLAPEVRSGVLSWAAWLRKVKRWSSLCKNLVLFALSYLPGKVFAVLRRNPKEILKPRPLLRLETLISGWPFELDFVLELEQKEYEEILQGLDEETSTNIRRRADVQQMLPVEEEEEDLDQRSNSYKNYLLNNKKHESQNILQRMTMQVDLPTSSSVEGGAQHHGFFASSNGVSSTSRPLDAGRRRILAKYSGLYDLVGEEGLHGDGQREQKDADDEDVKISSCVSKNRTIIKQTTSIRRKYVKRGTSGEVTLMHDVETGMFWLRDIGEPVAVYDSTGWFIPTTIRGAVGDVDTDASWRQDEVERRVDLQRHAVGVDGVRSSKSLNPREHKVDDVTRAACQSREVQRLEQLHDHTGTAAPSLAALEGAMNTYTALVGPGSSFDVLPSTSDGPTSPSAPGGRPRGHDILRGTSRGPAADMMFCKNGTSDRQQGLSCTGYLTRRDDMQMEGASSTVSGCAKNDDDADIAALISQLSKTSGVSALALGGADEEEEKSITTVSGKEAQIASFFGPATVAKYPRGKVTDSSWTKFDFDGGVRPVFRKRKGSTRGTSSCTSNIFDGEGGREVKSQDRHEGKLPEKEDESHSSSNKEVMRIYDRDSQRILVREMMRHASVLVPNHCTQLDPLVLMLITWWQDACETSAPGGGGSGSRASCTSSAVEKAAMDATVLTTRGRGGSSSSTESGVDSILLDTNVAKAPPPSASSTTGTKTPPSASSCTTSSGTSASSTTGTKVKRGKLIKSNRGSRRSRFVRAPRFVSHSLVAKYPAFGSVCRELGGIFVDRKSPASKKECAQAICDHTDHWLAADPDEREPLVVFGEGGLSNHEGILDLRSGAFQNPRASIRPIMLRYTPNLAETMWYYKEEDNYPSTSTSSTPGGPTLSQHYKKDASVVLDGGQVADGTLPGRGQNEKPLGPVVARYRKNVEDGQQTVPASELEGPLSTPTWLERHVIAPSPTDERKTPEKAPRRKVVVKFLPTDSMTGDDVTTDAWRDRVQEEMRLSFAELSLREEQK
ncbi:unnamed protein product [Amoebophrya sp. A25]|nr:unnamed protein product [Amoebophrya sp. A25]|eukprot:GSA25T00002388001.1